MPLTGSGKLEWMRRSFDVAIVGGGIAGGALACALSRAGFGVLLLERQQEYRDRVLGEGIVPWGVADARLDNPEGTLTLTHWFEYRMRALLYGDTPSGATLL